MIMATRGTVPMPNSQVVVFSGESNLVGVCKHEG